MITFATINLIKDLESARESLYSNQNQEIVNTAQGTLE
jgi:hypothetical protein